jgi:hypothetical protein
MRILHAIDLMLLIIVSGGSAAAQQCLHGPDELPQNKDRRHEAIKAVRFVNTAEARYTSKHKKYATLAELATLPGFDTMPNLMALNTKRR